MGDYGDNISIVEDVQYCRGIPSGLWRMLSIIEGCYQYCGGCSILWRDTISTMGGISSIWWRVFSTVGDTISTVGDNIIGGL